MSLLYTYLTITKLSLSCYVMFICYHTLSYLKTLNKRNIRTFINICCRVGKVERCFGSSCSVYVFTITKDEDGETDDPEPPPSIINKQLL